jgi:hypothetical protein
LLESTIRIRENLEILERFVANHGHDEGFQEITPWLSDYRALVGRGRGLTPSGDDYLLGLLLACALQRELGTPLSLENELREILPQMLSRTTRESAHYLEMGLQGHFSHGWIRLVNALFSREPFTIETWTWRLLQRGATSGTDTAMGLLHGLKIGDVCARES